jgi:hypothetical protein
MDEDVLFIGRCYFRGRYGSEGMNERMRWVVGL